MSKRDLQLVGIRIPMDLKKQLTALAEEDLRNFTSYVVKVLHDHAVEQKKNRTPRRNGLAIVHDKAAS